MKTEKIIHHHHIFLHDPLKIKLEVEVKESKPQDPFGHTNIHVVEVGFDKENNNMPVPDKSPKFTMHSSFSYGILAVVGPAKADGTYADHGTWSFVDSPDSPGALGTEVLPDEFVTDPETGEPVLDPQGLQIPVYKVKVLTPLTQEAVELLPGAKAGGKVTWKSVGIADNEIEVEYSDPALGHTIIVGSEFPE